MGFRGKRCARADEHGCDEPAAGEPHRGTGLALRAQQGRVGRGHGGDRKAGQRQRDASVGTPAGERGDPAAKGEHRDGGDAGGERKRSGILRDRGDSAIDEQPVDGTRRQSDGRSVDHDSTAGAAASLRVARLLGEKRPNAAYRRMANLVLSRRERLPARSADVSGHPVRARLQRPAVDPAREHERPLAGGCDRAR